VSYLPLFLQISYFRGVLCGQHNKFIFNTTYSFTSSLSNTFTCLLLFVNFCAQYVFTICQLLCSTCHMPHSTFPVNLKYGSFLSDFQSQSKHNPHPKLSTWSRRTTLFCVFNINIIFNSKLHCCHLQVYFKQFTYDTK